MPAKLQRMLRAFLGALSTEMDANDSPPECLHLTMNYGPWTLCVEARHGGQVTGMPPQDASRLPPELSEYELTILQAAKEVAAGKWVTSSQLAERSGYTLSSYFRDKVASLVSRGMLERRGLKIRLATPVATPGGTTTGTG